MAKYLITGQEVAIDTELGDYVFCRPIMVFDEYDYEGELIKVRKDMLFDKPPVAKIDEDIVKKQTDLENLKAEISAKRSELFDLKRQVQTESATVINKEKLIINRSDLLNAKTLALFPDKRIQPIFKDSSDKSMRGLKLSLTVEISNGSERSWGYKLYHEYDSTSDYLDPECGYLIDPTDDEVIEASFARQRRIKFDDWAIKNCPDRFLTPENLERKQALANDAKVKEVLKLEEDLIKIQDKLKAYKNVANTSSQT